MAFKLGEQGMVKLSDRTEITIYFMLMGCSITYYITISYSCSSM